ncbi:MAG: hypothetical protein LKJ71_11145 [Acetobacter peroxydans]|jgi:hypothetical protein|nr:hypothetical protein [Acetobacter peroxydans]
MKNQAIKFTDIHNGLKILSICIFVFFPLWAHAQGTKPEQKVLEFYQKYATACDQQSPEKPDVDPDDLFCNVEIKNILRMDYIKNSPFL